MCVLGCLRGLHACVRACVSASKGTLLQACSLGFVFLTSFSHFRVTTCTDTFSGLEFLQGLYFREKSPSTQEMKQKKKIKPFSCLLCCWLKKSISKTHKLISVCFSALIDFLRKHSLGRNEEQAKRKNPTQYWRQNVDILLYKKDNTHKSLAMRYSILQKVLNTILQNLFSDW